MYRWKDKRCLVTGGSGFIGGSLVKELLKRESIVDIVDNFSVGTPESVPEGVNEIYEGDLSKELLLKIKNNYDIVFHFGSPCTILFFDKDPLKYYFNSVTGSYGVREFCKERKIPYLVYASSASCYGSFSEIKNDNGYQEDRKSTPASMYGLEKATEENMDWMYPEIPFKLGLRIFPAYGSREYLKGDVASVPYKFCKEMIKGRQPEIWGSGKQSRDFIYIDDLVDCILSLIDRFAYGIFNIGTGTSVTYLQLVDIINQVLDTDIEPKFSNKPFEYNYVRDLVCDTTKLLEYLGRIRFTCIEDGIKRMIDEMLEMEID